LDTFDQTIDTLRHYTDRIRTGSGDSRSHNQHLKLLHVLDHMDRLSDRLRQTDRIQTIRETGELGGLGKQLSNLANQFGNSSAAESLPNDLDQLRKTLREERRITRERVLDLASRDKVELEDAFARVDAVRWLHRSTYHLWRISVHLLGSTTADAAKSEPHLEVELDGD
jgi:phosphate:Na+ symporter